MYRGTFYGSVLSSSCYTMLMLQTFCMQHEDIIDNKSTTMNVLKKKSWVLLALPELGVDKWPSVKNSINVQTPDHADRLRKKTVPHLSIVLSF